MTKKEFNRIRDRALARCSKAGTTNAAREAWDSIVSEAQKTIRGKTRQELARLAMLEVLAKGKSLAEAKKAGREALA